VGPSQLERPLARRSIRAFLILTNPVVAPTGKGERHPQGLFLPARAMGAKSERRCAGSLPQTQPEAADLVISTPLRRDPGPATFMPGVPSSHRGVRGSNPLSSTEILKVRGLFEFLWLYMGSRCGSQVVTSGMAEAKRCGYGEDGIYFDHRGNCRELGPHIGDLHADHPGAGRDTRGPPPGLLVTVDRPRPRLRHQRSKRRGIG
jgi:hypothetical protein